MLKRFFLILFFVIIIAAIFTGWMWRRLDQPYRGFSGDEIFVDLPPGLHVSDIASRLADAGVVPDALTFRIAARIGHDDRRLEAGEYRFAAAATPYTVAWRLAHGDVFRVTLKFPEGLTIAEMAPIFARSGLGSADDFLAAASRPLLIGARDPAATDLEGYLFPSTYALSRHTGADGAIRAMLKAFDHAFNGDVKTAAIAQGMSMRDVVTIASLVERETAQPDERPIVSAVYRNRLKIGMLLQCDPTVIYAMMRDGRWNGNITRADLQRDEPYNTYRRPGLPPGPIAAPGLASLEAAVHPADVPYLYFVSKGDGTHAFSSTLADQTKNVLRYQIKR